MAQDLKELRLIPGVNTEFTPTLAQAAIVDCNNIRWKNGLFEQIGGWIKFYPTTLGTAFARALWGWQDFNLNQHLAVGSHDWLKVISGQNGIPILQGGTNNQINDVTPRTATTNEPPQFSTTAGSNIVTVVDPGFVGPSLDDTVYIQTPVSIGGLIVYGTYSIYALLGPNSYQIQAAKNATTTAGPNGVVPTYSTSGTPAAPSAAVTVVLPNHGLQVGESFAILQPVTVGGLTMFGNYLVQPPPTAPNFTANQFTITAANVTTQTAGPVSQNNGNVEITYYITIGPNAKAIGWGELAWGFPGGGILDFNPTFAAGSGYVPGTYPDVTLTGGTGVPPARATITVGAGGTVTLVSLTFQGGMTTPYTIGDVLSAPASALGGSGSGFSITVADVTTAGGWGTGIAPLQGAGVPITADGSVNDWSMFNWGDILIFNPAGGGVYAWEPQSANQNGSLIAAAPIKADGIFLATPQQILVCWGVTGGQNTQISSAGTAANIGVQNPLRLVWSDAGNYNIFTASPATFAGGFDLSSGSRIVACKQGAQMFGVWTDIGVWSGTYVGQPLVFSIIEVMQGCGLVGRKALGSLGTTFYWMSQNQFFRMSAGGVPTEMPCTVWDKVFQNINRNMLDKVRFYSNAAFNEIGWFFPTGTNLENDTLVKYDTAQNLWDYCGSTKNGPFTIAAQIARSAWIDQSILGPPIGTGIGNPPFIYQHETGTLADGAAINCYILTGDIVLGLGDEYQFVDYFIPDFRWGVFGQIGSQFAQAQISFLMKDWPNDSGIPADPSQFPQIDQGPFTVSEAVAYIEPRLRGRALGMLIQWSSSYGSFLRGGLCRYRATPDGRNP